MRTTVDLPDDLHQVLVALARDRDQTMSQTVVDLVRLALGASGSVAVSTDPRTSLPVVRVGRPVTAEDVRSLDDEP